ncbi:MAG: indolepyruvate oxidoreductase subunit beta [Dehalococcoidales bacterium]|jgi:indolepyruvate ferredoxin oxidoreductase beta subunit
MVKLNIIIAGVGGQGVELASDILGEVALETGLAVKKMDTQGIAQHDGSIVTQLRIGDEVAAPLTGEDEADILLAFEKGEAARLSDYLRLGASAVVNDLTIPPLSISPGGESFPKDDEITDILSNSAATVMLINGSQRVAEMGGHTVLNAFMLGALSMLLPFNPELWEKVIARRLPPKILDINLAAFKQGRRDMLEVFSAIQDEDSCDTETQDDDCGCH